MFSQQSVRLFVICVALCSFVSVAPAQVTIHVPSDQPSIQSAINVASTGDTVLVAPGTYKEDITFLGKAITVTSSGGATQTIIDGGQSGPVVSFNNSETRTSVLNAFTITDDAPPLPISDQGVTAAGIFVGGASPTITNNIITGNRGFGILVYQGGPLVQDNTISHTVTAGDPAGDFGCDYDDGSAIEIFQSSTPQAEILGNKIEFNKAQCRGGALQVGYGAAPLIENNIIDNNISLGYGGAISLINGDQLTLIQNLIYGNNAGAAGGALYLALVSETDYNSGPVDLFIVNNTIVGNSITPNPLIEDDYVDGSQIAFPGYVSQVGMYNNIIEAGDTDGAISCDPTYSYLSATPPLMDHNDLLNTGGPRFSGWCADQNGSNGNISTDPKFSNLAGGDFHLKVGSPAIDSGNNAAPSLPSLDLGSSPRIQNATGVPYPIIDLGAYEVPGPANLSATQTSLSAQPQQTNYGASLSLLAAVTAPSAISSGTVGFFDGTTQLGQASPSSGGAASISTSQLNAGTHVITAAFSGNSTLAGSASSPVSVVVAGETTATTLTFSPASPVYPQDVTFTATVQSAFGIPTGNVTFYEEAEPIVSLPLNAQGMATYTLKNRENGLWTFSAVYPIQGPFASSASQPVSVFIQPIPTTIALTASPNPGITGQSATFTATVQGTSLTPSGFVIFSGGPPGMGTANLNAKGVATSVLSNLPAGSYSITGTFIPTGCCFAQAISQPLSFTVSAADFSVSASPAVLGINTGQTGQTTLTITPVGGYAGTIAFSCTGLPGGATCKFNPSSLSPSGDNSTSATNLAVTAPAAAGGIANPMKRPQWPGGEVFMVALLLLMSIAPIVLLRASGRLLYLRAAPVFLGVLCAFALTSCGGGSSGSPPPPAPVSTTYTVVVTAAGANNFGTTTHSTNLTVTITQ